MTQRSKLAAGVPPRLATRRVEVKRSEWITPGMVRVSFGGDELDDFEISGPTAQIKLFLPAPGDAEPHVPRFTASGPKFAEGVRRPIVRTYTPRRFDPSRRELDIEFAVHGTGSASRWAAEARPGDKAAVTRPRGAYTPDPAAEWLLIAGDESALPAIGTLIESSLPATVNVVVEVQDVRAEHRWGVVPGMNVTWVHRRGATAGSALEAAIQRLDLPFGRGQAWVAGEASSIRRVRRHLIDERGFAPSDLVTRGYWKHGEPNYTDHDYGES